MGKNLIQASKGDYISNNPEPRNPSLEEMTFACNQRQASALESIARDLNRIANHRSNLLDLYTKELRRNKKLKKEVIQLKELQRGVAQ